MNVRFKSCFLKSCYRDLNSGPLPYQGSALPLSYNSRLRAENGAQTRDPQLGRLVLYQLSYFRNRLPIRKWVVMDSNHRSRKTTDIQSAPFGRSGNHPLKKIRYSLTCHQIACDLVLFLSLLSDSNQRPRDYKSRALAN